MLICIICTCIRHITGLHAYANGKTKFGICLILYNSSSNHNYVSLVKILYQSIPFPPQVVMAGYYGLKLYSLYLALQLDCLSCTLHSTKLSRSFLLRSHYAVQLLPWNWFYLTTIDHRHC